MKKFAQIGLVMAIVFMSSVALVACGGKGDIANGTYVIESYKTGTDTVVTHELDTDKLLKAAVTDNDAIITAGYISEIVIDGTKFTSKEKKGTAAVTTKVDGKEYTVETETVKGTDIPTGYTFKDDKITFTSGTGADKVVIVYVKK